MEKKMESKNGECVMVYGTTSTGTNTGEMEGHGTLRQPSQCGTEKDGLHVGLSHLVI